MSISRRHFIASATAVAAGFSGLRHWVSAAEQGSDESSDQRVEGYGPLVKDPEGVLDLPDGFHYQVIGRQGTRMDDGFLLPGAPDGMATFPLGKDRMALIRNHELNPRSAGPWGPNNELISELKASQVYDRGSGKTPGCGGTTTVIYDTRRQQVVRQFLSLAGTWRNCAGGPTPWQSWVTCEETVARTGYDEADGYHAEQDHGYNFEVPVHTTPQLAEPVPLKAMGRFNHEAIAVEPRTSVVYQTEDRGDGCFYRFLPNVPGKLAAGGKLQALVVTDRPSVDTRNWNPASQAFVPGQEVDVHWIDLDEVEAPLDDLRLRAFEAGAARFARGEGIWRASDGFYFACTNGGVKQKGQIWRYTPSLRPDADAPEKSGTLELFIEPNDAELVEAADNLTVAPWGDLIVCEDRSGEMVRIVGVTPAGKLYTFARNHVHTEFAGATFSPDGSTLFVNLQGRGLTVAITGPFRD